MGRDPWKSLVMAVAGDFEHLKHSSMTLIFRENSAVCCRSLVVSVPPYRVWGIPLKGCPEATCSATRLDFQSEVPKKFARLHEKARFSCNICGFRTNWIQRPSWIHEVGALYPRRFWFDFPVHHSHFAAFDKSLLEHQVNGKDRNVHELPMEIDPQQ
jgi:hypothetical protein